MYNFVIEDNFPVKGGTASYDFDPTINPTTGKGNLSFLAKVDVFLIGTQPESGNYPVDPTLLLSASVRTVGKEIPFGNATFTVTAVDDTGVNVEVVVTGSVKGKGTGRLLTTGQYVEAVSLDAEVSISGFNLHLVATPAKA